MFNSPITNPYGGPDKIVDKKIGDAYVNVKKVSEVLGELLQIAAYIENLVTVSDNLDIVAPVSVAIDDVSAVANNLNAINAILADIDYITQYLGSYDEVPTERPDGSSLLDGDFYFNGQGLVYYDSSTGSWLAVNPGDISSAANTVLTKYAELENDIAALSEQVDGYMDEANTVVESVQDALDTANTIKDQANALIGGSDIGDYTDTENPPTFENETDYVVFGRGTEDVSLWRVRPTVILPYTVDSAAYPHPSDDDGHLVAYSATADLYSYQEEYVLAAGQQVITTASELANFAVFIQNTAGDDVERLFADTHFTFDRFGYEINLKATYPTGSKVILIFNDVGQIDDSYIKKAEASSLYGDHTKQANRGAVNSHPATAIQTTGGASVETALAELENRANGIVYHGTDSTNGIQHAENGDTVPAGSELLSVLVDGKVVDCVMYPVGAGQVNNLTASSATIGGELIKLIPKKDYLGLKSVAIANNTTIDNVAFLQTGVSLTANILRDSANERTLIAWDTLTTPYVISSVSANIYAGYDVVTDQGTFEFVTREVYEKRIGYGYPTSEARSLASAWGVTGDNPDDDELKIDKAIQYCVNKNSTLIIDVSGNFNQINFLDGTRITVARDMNLTGSSNTDTDPNRSLFAVVGVTGYCLDFYPNITLTQEENAVYQEFCNCININNSSDGFVGAHTALNFDGDGVYMTGVDGLVVDRPKAVNAGRNGISITTDVVNTVINSPRHEGFNTKTGAINLSAIDIEPNEASNYGIVINNPTGECSNYGVEYGLQMYFEQMYVNQKNAQVSIVVNNPIYKGYRVNYGVLKTYWSNDTPETIRAASSGMITITNPTSVNHKNNAYLFDDINARGGVSVNVTKPKIIIYHSQSPDAVQPYDGYNVVFTGSEFRYLIDEDNQMISFTDVEIDDRSDIAHNGYVYGLYNGYFTDLVFDKFINIQDSVPILTFPQNGVKTLSVGSVRMTNKIQKTIITSQTLTLDYLLFDITNAGISSDIELTLPISPLNGEFTITNRSGTYNVTVKAPDNTTYINSSPENYVMAGPYNYKRFKRLDDSAYVAY